MLRYVIGLVALLTIISSSCSTDLNLTGDYEEQAIVYSLLDTVNNPSRGGNGHLFRIQKVFLGEASAFEMAMVADSSYFNYDSTLVEVLDIDADGDTNNRWMLDTVHIATKEEGDFFGPKQRLYLLEEDVHENHSYMLVITNQQSGYQATSVINMLGESSFRWTNPSENSPATYRGLNLKRNDGTYFDIGIDFSTADNAADYELWLTFYYREVVDTDTTQHELNWRVGSNSFAKEDGEGADNGVLSLSGEQVFSYIGSNIESNPSIVRLIGKDFNNNGTLGKGGPDAFELTMYIAGTEFSEFLTISNSSGTASGSLTSVPTYSNINNGLGVFSCRTSKKFLNLVPNDSDDLQEFISGQYTGGLQFTTDE
jgi:hypothetical protein